MTGMFYYSINFGGSTLTSKGSYDMYVASFDSSGKHRWSKSAGSTSSDYGYAIDSDSNGNVYVTGYFYYNANFGGSTLTSKGGYDVFLVSFDSSGKHRWSKNFGSTSTDYGFGVAVDGSGNVYITGMHYSTINFGGSNLTSSGSYDIFLASFTPSGVHRWSKNFGGTSSDYGYGVAVDKSGNVYLTGMFYYTVNFGGSALSSNGIYDAYIASFTPAGGHRWSKSFGSTSSDYGYGIATDPKGNVFFTGYFYNSIKFGTKTHSSAGSYDIFITSFNSTGGYRWSRTHGSTSSDYGRALSVDPSGDLFTTGYFYYTVDFGGGTLTASSADTFLLKLEQ